MTKSLPSDPTMLPSPIPRSGTTLTPKQSELTESPALPPPSPHSPTSTAPSQQQPRDPWVEFRESPHTSWASHLDAVEMDIDVEIADAWPWDELRATRLLSTADPPPAPARSPRAF